MRSRREGRRALRGGTRSLNLSFVRVCSSSGHCPDFAAPKQSQERAFLGGCPQGQHGVSGSAWEALGWGGRMVLGAAAYGGGGRGWQGRAQRSQPHPSAIALPRSPGSRTSRHQPSENCSFHCACAAGYLFGLTLSQCSWAKRASVSPLEPALPNPPLLPSTPGATSPAPAWVEMGATHAGATFSPRALVQPRDAGWLPAPAEPSPPSSPEPAPTAPINRLDLLPQHLQ